MIRTATPDDLPAIAALHLQSWRTTYDGLLPADYLGAGAEAQLRAKWADLPRGTTLVAMQGDRLAGFISVNTGNPAYLDALHIAGFAQGGGLGPRLIAAAFAQIAAQGVTAAYLYIVDGNDGARRFYERLGAMETWRGPDPDYDFPSTAIRLDWRDISPLVGMAKAP
ncbi:Ribosomal protein S18 acetylase RimI [Monaibacterium marinum]|uniref:Ribosomal protein S18 acetylase RimI n=1 Tax=Pontivivens marinum TaxID=1690039 RepID=A0A2C9CU17_9RHOB|nr:GNAT family N-acetyltransferase [Monaibacterium marinum]SOH94690.1 Ribosomal protein S18 acetylase RimI [Monaibacterium marinum]